MNHHVRLRECTYALLRMWCSASTPVFCVSGCVWFCVWGAALGAARFGSTPPTPKGRHPASRHTRPLLADPQGARAEEVPDCSSYPLRIPWIASAVGCQSTLARLRLFLSPRLGDSTPTQAAKGQPLQSPRPGDSTPIQVVKGQPLQSPRSGDSTPVQVVRGTSAVAKQAARRSPIFKKCIRPGCTYLPLFFEK